MRGKTVEKQVEYLVRYVNLGVAVNVTLLGIGTAGTSLALVHINSLILHWVASLVLGAMAFFAILVMFTVFYDTAKVIQQSQSDQRVGQYIHDVALVSVTAYAFALVVLGGIGSAVLLSIGKPVNWTEVLTLVGALAFITVSSNGAILAAAWGLQGTFPARAPMIRVRDMNQ